MQELGLYIHIPFCERKCAYCDFLSFDQFSADVHKLYFDALKSEIKARSNKEYSVDSVFFGGGTPSVAGAAFIKQILDLLREHFNIKSDAEISVEANPNSIKPNELAQWLEAGVNRLSIGAQSTSANVLSTLGRIHGRDIVFSSFSEAMSAGFNNINMDLIFAVPGQSEEIWEQTLVEILGLRPEHISFYSLEIEEGTPLFQRLINGELTPVDEAIDRWMYHRALSLLKDAGFVHYEISNAALPGYECRHNLKYWSLKDYLGLGLGAHSFIDGCRFSNTVDLSVYLAEDSEFRDHFHRNSESDSISEFMFLGLRRIRGVSAAEFKRCFGKDLFKMFGCQIDKMTAAGLLKSCCEKGDISISLTNKGIDVSNCVFTEFI